jgi:uncharacterized protein (UPF0261 family)
MTTVVLLGSLDTKGAEYQFARDRLRELGAETIVVDTGVLGEPSFDPDVTAAQVAAAGGTELDELRRRGDRAGALAVMSRGATALLGGLRTGGRLDGAFALGGSGNTTVAAAAFRALPLGVPKLIVSTMTAGNLREFVGDSDLVMAASVVDIAGLNRISRVVIGNAAAAIAGMAAAPPVAGAADRPLIAASMIGLTTRAVTAARRRLEDLGYEVLVFHMTGAGGAAMEALIDRGLVAGVLDLTTSELADELGGGVCSAGPGRLRAAARRGIPQVVAPGGLDMINFGRPDTVPARYAGRVRHQHNSEITLVRTSAAESAELGRWLVERVSAAPEQAGPASPASAADPAASAADPAASAADPAASAADPAASAADPAASAADAAASAADPASTAGQADAPDRRPVILLPSGGLSAIDAAGQPFRDAVADAALSEAVQTAADPGRVRVLDVAGNLDRAETGTLAADLLDSLISLAHPPLISLTHPPLAASTPPTPPTPPLPPLPPLLPAGTDSPGGP